MEATASLDLLWSVLYNILNFFQGGYMRAICTVALGACAAGLLLNRGEPGIVKKLLPWIFAVSILLSLNGIIGLIFSVARL